MKGQESCALALSSTCLYMLAASVNVEGKWMM